VLCNVLQRLPLEGVCAGGAAHQGQSLNFLLPHDVPSTATAQSGWRFCEKCSVAFFDGYADKGHCRAGGGHVAAGYTFVLPHGPQTPIFRAHPSASMATPSLAAGRR
jgi:hypothetical protein